MNTIQRRPVAGSVRPQVPSWLRCAAACVCAGAFAGAAQGQFDPTMPPAYYAAPTTAMGTLVDNLVITQNVNGFVVTGQVVVTVPPAPISGILAQWTIVRRIDPVFSGSGLMTNTVLTGFSLPPLGTFGATSGTVATEWRYNAGRAVVGGSQSSVPMTLVNGVDSPPWTGLSNNSGGSGFTWTAGFFPGAVMQQTFTIFGNYLTGPGGTWIIDVPVISETIVPPPPCPADATGNGEVNIDDLLAVINAWGVCPNPRKCPADIAPPGGNDEVNIDDLLAVINGWGVCP